MPQSLDVIQIEPEVREAVSIGAPVVALDERPVQLVDSLRPDTPIAPGQPARRDYEYARCGTANVFCVVEPKTGRHQTHATKNRTATQFARALKRIARSYPAARPPFIWSWIISTPIGKSRSPPPLVRKRDTGCGGGSPARDGNDGTCR